MTTNKMRAIHAGEILREEFLAPLGMTHHALAINLRVPAPRINDVVREKRAITVDTVHRNESDKSKFLARHHWLDKPAYSHRQCV